MGLTGKGWSNCLNNIIPQFAAKRPQPHYFIYFCLAAWQHTVSCIARLCWLQVDCPLSLSLRRASLFSITIHSSSRCFVRSLFSCVARLFPLLSTAPVTSSLPTLSSLRRASLIFIASFSGYRCFARPLRRVFLLCRVSLFPSRASSPFCSVVGLFP
jgi:hypothetical protein